MENTQFRELPMTLTVEEVSKLLRVGRNTAYRLIQEGNIRCIRCGRKIIIPKDALEEFLTKIG